MRGFFFGVWLKNDSGDRSSFVIVINFNVTKADPI